ncbi:MAG: S8 family serine peptidase [Candidatus Thiodiazotropha lotti]|nr:S8 family serine peptidase [Candidatus Thiodiazotropha lotti]MCG8001611.1 S8 family serine peptidase [Candidatus Thiodiazotropha lotti]MCW4182225.1 S8 family serine peptidase [Candidatus Thiodiazotropha weberae]MCW4193385.1 S8 family serine peptidase [Candidatus Thiodiazotropha weberae]
MLNRFTTAVVLAALTIYQPMLFAAAALTADAEKLVSDATRLDRVPVIVRFAKEYSISELKEQHQKSEQFRSRKESRTLKRKQFRQNVFSSLQQQTREASARLSELLRKHGVKTRLKSLWTINGIALDVPPEMIDAISALPGVERVTADMRLTMNTPEVEDVDSQPQWNIEKLNAARLWEREIRGEGVVVGIMDSGVDVNHPDLADRWRGGDNSWFDPYYGDQQLPIDLVGHGTQALGLILAGDESGYQVGMAPEAKWIAARIFDNANQTTLSAIHLAFQWLLDPDGDPLTDDAPHLVNNSWGFANTINQCYQEFDEDIRLLREAGIGVVFSAGNYGPFAETSISPANNSGSLSVGAIDLLDEIEFQSSRGPNACDGGIYPKLVAPGSQVYTTDRLPVAYNVVSGTSFAAPHITGALALLKSAFPDTPISQIETALYDSAVDLGETGVDDQYGYGLADVSAAYDLLLSNSGSADESLLIFNESQYSVDENTSRLIVTVRRVGSSEGEVSVEFTTSDDDAVAGSDYLSQSGRLTFADVETLRTIEIPIINDRDDEENEAFQIVLSDVRGDAALGHQDEVEVVILDDDGAGTVAFSSVSVAVNESRGEALVSLVRTDGTAGTIEVGYRTVADTALAEVDFVETESTVRFLPGETEKQISIELIDDDLFEESERFQLMITELDGDADIGSPASTTISILNDDPDTNFATISLESVSYEVRENAGQLRVTLFREGNLDIDATVEYNTLNGSANANEDYHAISGTLTFAAGFSRRTLTIDIINDTIYEQESSFTLILSNAGGGAVISDPSTAIIRIIDDDALPFVSIQSPTPSSTIGSSNSSQFGQQSSSGRQENRGSGESGSSGLQVFEINLRKYGRARAEEQRERMANMDAESKQKADQKSSCGSAEDQANCKAAAESSEQTEELDVSMPEDTAGDEPPSDQSSESETESQTENSASPPAETEPATVESEQS